MPCLCLVLSMPCLCFVVSLSCLVYVFALSGFLNVLLNVSFDVMAGKYLWSVPNPTLPTSNPITYPLFLSSDLVLSVLIPIGSFGLIFGPFGLISDVSVFLFLFRTSYWSFISDALLVLYFGCLNG